MRLAWLEDRPKVCVSAAFSVWTDVPGLSDVMGSRSDRCELQEYLNNSNLEMDEALSPFRYWTVQSPALALKTFQRFAFVHLFEGADGKQLKIHGLFIHCSYMFYPQFILFCEQQTTNY